MSEPPVGASAADSLFPQAGTRPRGPVLPGDPLRPRSRMRTILTVVGVIVVAVIVALVLKTCAGNSGGGAPGGPGGRGGSGRGARCGSTRRR